MLAIGTLPIWAKLPAPDLPAITQAVQLGADGRPRPLELPRLSDEPGQTVHYRLNVHIDRADRPLYLFIPLLSQRAIIAMDGMVIADSSNRGVMQGLSSGTTLLVMLPENLLGSGSHVFDVELQSIGAVRGYLSPMYVGTAQELAPYYRLSVFVFEYLLIMVVAAQVLMALCVLVVWLYRPREPLFGWLTSMLLLSMCSYIGMSSDLLSQMADMNVYATMLGSSASFILVIVALLISGWVPPRWLKLSVAIVPTISILWALASSGPPQWIFLLFNAPLNLACVLVSVVIVWRAVRLRAEEDARLLLVPLFLLMLVTLHDFVVALHVRDKPLFLGLYYRPLLMVGIGMILMRRLGTSLMQLDDANDHLRRSLAQREAELARMHEEDRRKAAAQVRHEERRRLTVDLHDGLSGHLASIIALAEREGSPAIERTAREALDDLRLVIHSLDIGDKELGVALSGLRERLERQLRRLGIGLDWSTANLPEISGVTPTQALNVLRIVQEALTNAMTHGRARHIRVYGSATADGRASLSIENDGEPFCPGVGGRGLYNMRRRVKQLGGEISIEQIREGTRVTLVLPLQLPGCDAMADPGPAARAWRAGPGEAAQTAPPEGSILDASSTASRSHGCIDAAVLRIAIPITE